MKNLFLAILLFSSLTIFGQVNPPRISSELCNRETDGKGNSNNLKIKLSVPCNWAKIAGTQPNIVLNYEYNTTGKLRVALTITKLPKEVTDAEVKSHFTVEGLKTIGSNSSGTVISSKLLTVNNLKGGEVIRRTISKKNGTDLYYYGIQNYFVFDRNLICIEYLYSALKDDFESNYETYLKTFRSLVTRTTFAKAQ